MYAGLRSFCQSSSFLNDSTVSGLASISVVVLELYTVYGYSVSSVARKSPASMQNRDNPFGNLTVAIVEHSLALVRHLDRVKYPPR